MISPATPPKVTPATAKATVSATARAICSMALKSGARKPRPMRASAAHGSWPATVRSASGRHMAATARNPATTPRRDRLAIKGLDPRGIQLVHRQVEQEDALLQTDNARRKGPRDGHIV